MALAKNILVATALTGIFSMANLGAVQAGDCPAVTTAFEQDEDLLTPEDRVLCRNPHAYPGWTWMTKSQAIVLLKAAGFSDVVRLEKAGSSWRGEATNDDLSYHVAIDRYARVLAHLDKKSREQRVVAHHTAMAHGSQ